MTLPLLRCVRTSAKPASVSSSFRSAIAILLVDPRLIPRNRTAYRGTAGGYSRIQLRVVRVSSWKPTWRRNAYVPSGGSGARIA